MTKTTIAAASSVALLAVGYVCGRISHRWRMWRYMKRGGMG